MCPDFPSHSSPYTPMLTKVGSRVSVGCQTAGGVLLARTCPGPSLSLQSMGVVCHSTRSISHISGWFSRTLGCPSAISLAADAFISPAVPAASPSVAAPGRGRGGEVESGAQAPCFLQSSLKEANFLSSLPSHPQAGTPSHTHSPLSASLPPSPQSSLCA